MDPGDQFVVEIYLSGWGRVDSSKLSMIYPTGFFRIDRDSGTRRVPGGVVTLGPGILGIGPDREHITQEVAVHQPLSFPVDDVGAVLAVNRSIIMARDEAGWPDQLPPSIGELRSGVNPPLLLRNRISPEAPSGDNSLRFIFTYVIDSQDHTSTYDLAVHLRAWWESPYAYALVIAASVAAIGASFLELLVRLVPGI